MIHKTGSFQLDEVLHALHHYLPTQAPLKDFIHHNSLHAFQHLPFFDGCNQASTIFGYKTSLSLKDYRKLYEQGKVRPEILERVLIGKFGADHLDFWKQKLLHADYPYELDSRIGKLRNYWKSVYKLDLDALVYPMLFRLISAYLDQGISIWNFPANGKSFLSSLRDLDRESAVSLFQSERCKQLFANPNTQLSDLLEIVCGDESLFEQYLFDTQFGHQGWSGMVAFLEHNPSALLDTRPIKLHDFIFIELLLEINALDMQIRGGWLPLNKHAVPRPTPLFAPVISTELQEIIKLWQEAFEWSYYDQVLAGIAQREEFLEESENARPPFQALFCIDDRECSIRRYVEQVQPGAKTYGTPGFFGVAFFYQPKNGKFLTKLCPAPVTPSHVIREINTKGLNERDAHFDKKNQGIVRGWIISQTLGFWSALKLAYNIFKPSIGPATTYSFNHMDSLANLTYENKDPNQKYQGLQVGFTIAEMTDRVEALLKSIGLTNAFSKIIYVVAHGASSVNNTHYAGYDCGACSGRPGSVNARVVSLMANHPEVRLQLRLRGLDIPSDTVFIGALHDTTRDEMVFYDEKNISPEHASLHANYAQKFNQALDLNAKERSRRFILTPTQDTPERVHERVKLRSVSLFEPRPELNHATNALCIIGRRALTDHLFLDRRSFMNSYDYRIDTDGKLLESIMRPIGPVCGGINLEYFFSRVDNQKLGAGTKLPHNVVGLIAVANGIEGDLRPGLPSQMIEVHDPIRLLVIVEQTPDKVLQAIQQSPETYEWFIQEWVHICAVEPETNHIYRFKSGAFYPYIPVQETVPELSNLEQLIEQNEDNLPVFILND